MRDAPYPADTRAKGWRFELDYEQIEQSDTWPLAAEIPMAQHALLMMWFVAWAQLPCGSLPNDEAVIRVKCKLPPAVWARCREVLMRGWWLASDDRLYHDTLVKRVFEMMGRRRSDSDRQAARRARLAEESALLASDSAVSPPVVTPLSRVTPPGLHRESSTDNRQPITEEEKREKPPRKRVSAPELLRPDDVAEQIWCDWVQLRKGKRAAVSETVLREARAEADKAELTLEQFLSIWCFRGSQGLQADWLKPHEKQQAQSMTFRERDAANAAARVGEFTGGLAVAKPVTRRNDALQEVFDATPRLVG